MTGKATTFVLVNHRWQTCWACHTAGSIHCVVCMAWDGTERTPSAKLAYGLADGAFRLPGERETGQ